MFASDIDEKFGRLRYSWMVLDLTERKESREKNKKKRAEDEVVIMTKNNLIPFLGQIDTLRQ